MLGVILGKTAKEAASELGITQHTVEVHRRNVMLANG